MKKSVSLPLVEAIRDVEASLARFVEEDRKARTAEGSSAGVARLLDKVSETQGELRRLRVVCQSLVARWREHYPRDGSF